MDDRTQIESVLKSLEAMVLGDGGAIRLNSFDSTISRLVVDYKKSTKSVCESCVLDPESIHDFIVEALENRGVQVTEVVLQT
jgi:Fe-S cluster biogenesis protein NfuA